MSMEAARAHLEQFGLEGRIRLGGCVQGLAAGGIMEQRQQKRPPRSGSLFRTQNQPAVK